MNKPVKQRPVGNNTGTELDVLKKLEAAFYRNNPEEVRRNTAASMDWFRKYIPRAMNKVKTSQLFRDQSTFKTSVVPGNMYFFEYDAKTKDTLPVWDRYPLIFPWRTWESSEGHTLFIGINLHYLPPVMRYQAMKALLTLRADKRYNERVKLNISWETLKAMSQHKMFEHSVKQYRLDHVRSRFVKIPAQSWEMVAFLPLARWQKGTKETAWKM